MKKPKIVCIGLYVLICAIDLSFLYAQDAIRIEEGYYEERPHFIVYTLTATYYYDKVGGGFSRMIDQKGNDWIGFKKEPWNAYPASAASSYRGLPNLVFRSDDGGAGHPGFDQCTSLVDGERQIVTESKSGKWRWRWTFYEDHAVLEIEKTDPQQAYWFLYEGAAGGEYAPEQYYFGSDSRDSSLSRPKTQHPDLSKGTANFGKYQWMYVGHQQVDRILFMLQIEPDEHQDLISYMGNSERGVDSEDGMTVFGFGRGPQTQALLSEPQSFVIGFYPYKITGKADHLQLRKYVNGLMQRYRSK
ncbi:hypothetical protein OKW21_006086 [Catalinimonas alkaloidigena]|uniref:hypothetical protein n=1 Tax=Catalinimonas alkaloidigena TaxID=1075417 RepID=UPI002405C109|nr:hypothetical protein [Catalinimonas alkaloidigena]MDF9800823.1 hypothetical protein [Catalinimonas alkaloidigena]